MIKPASKLKKTKDPNILSKKMIKEKIKLIYICSLSNSGSTLLDLILGANEGIESVGEIINLEDRLEHNKSCTCRKKISDCDYWNSIFNTVTNEYNIDIKNAILKEFNLLKNLRKEQTKHAIKGDLISWLKKNNLKKYAIINYLIFNSIRKNTGKDIILDSSKDSLRLLILHLYKIFDIKVIHLYRDLRGNIESIKRKANDPEREFIEYKGILWHMIELWRMILKEVYYLRFFDKRKKLKIRYRDFALNPERELKKICDFAGISFDHETISDSAKHFSLKKNHNIGGNRLRFNMPKDIIYKQKWPGNLTRREKFVFILCGGVFLNHLQHYL